MSITIVSKTGIKQKYNSKTKLIEKIATINRVQQERKKILEAESSRKWQEENRRKGIRNAKVQEAKEIWWNSLSDREKEIQKSIRINEYLSYHMWRSHGQDFEDTGNGIVFPEYKDSYKAYLKRVREIEEYEKNHSLTPPTWIHLL